ncbi:hypothetical protein Ahia01_000032400 [Argonauta hians]
MLNGKRRHFIFKNGCEDITHSPLEKLYEFSFQESLHQFYNELVYYESINGITDGWKKITSINVLEPKNATKPKKKLNGQSRFVNRKKMKLLFTDNLKLIYGSEKFEYIPLNGIYQSSKSEASVDSLNCRKPSKRLLPLNEPITMQKHAAPEDNPNKVYFSLSPSETDNTSSSKHKTVTSSSSFSDLRIGVTNSLVVMKKSVHKPQTQKNKNPESKTSYAIFQRFKEIFFEGVVPPDYSLGKNMNYYNSTAHPQIKYSNFLSSFQLKSEEKKYNESNYSFKNIELQNNSGIQHSNYHANGLGMSILKTRGLQGSKKGNKTDIISCVHKNLNLKNNGYNFIIQHGVVLKQPPESLNEEVLPEIFGKKMTTNPSIHRWL